MLVLGVDRAWLHGVDDDLISVAVQLGLECGAIHGGFLQGWHQASAVYAWLATRRPRTDCFGGNAEPGRARSVILTSPYKGICRTMSISGNLVRRFNDRRMRPTLTGRQAM